MEIGELMNPVLVGEGAFGKVYRVKEEKTGTFLAMKVMDAKYRAIWEKEVKALQCADHDLFPKLVEAGEEDEGLYLLMEYVWGNPLDEVILRRKGFAQPEAMRLAISIADGIAWLQQKESGMLFRDLKAENLIMMPDGNVKCIDLGCVCALDQANNSEAGTPGCSAPEQFQNSEETGLYSDVYAFGKLLFFMLTGLAPNKQQGSLREVDPSLSACLELLIEDCTRAVKEERIPDMLGVVSRLIEIAGCTSWKYRKLEKAAEKELEKRKKNSSSNVVYEKNVRRS